jgi:iron-sulfur cluster assembly protein
MVLTPCWEKPNAMLHITKTARKMIREIVEQEANPSPIRVTMAGGCIGPHLGMLFDSARRNDETFEVEGVYYVIDKELLFRFRPITVDYTNNASGGKFNVTSPHHDTEP